jgi:hypothetical protein
MLVDQSAPDFDIERKRRTRTHLAEPLCADLIGKISKPEYRYVNRASFAGRRVFHKITHASGAMKLDDRLAGFDVYLAMFYVRPLMAIPCLARHGKKSPE